MKMSNKPPSSDNLEKNPSIIRENSMSQTKQKTSKFVELLAVDQAENLPALNTVSQEKMIEDRIWTGSKEDVEFATEHKLLNEDSIELIQQKIERHLIDVTFEKFDLVRAGGKQVIVGREVDTEHMKRNEDGSFPTRKPPFIINTMRHLIILS
jgi:hypothetical protein